jgi:hypothetical protein
MLFVVVYVCIYVGIYISKDLLIKPNTNIFYPDLMIKVMQTSKYLCIAPLTKNT